jgi:hypothetical protein
MEEERKNITFKPNREQTKKADAKIASKRSPERIEKYIQDFNDRTRKPNLKT